MTPASSLWTQLLLPHPSWLQALIPISPPVQWTLSSQIVPFPWPKCDLTTAVPPGDRTKNNLVEILCHFVKQLLWFTIFYVVLASVSKQRISLSTLKENSLNFVFVTFQADTKDVMFLQYKLVTKFNKSIFAYIEKKIVHYIVLVES